MPTGRLTEPRSRTGGTEHPLGDLCDNGVRRRPRGGDERRHTLDGPRAPAARGRHLLAWEYTEEWAYESPTGEMMAALLRPGRERLLYFHVIARGRCWVAIEDGEPHWAEKGDVVVLPYGHQHQMGGTTETECVSVLDLMSPPPWTEFPVVRHGSGGERTDVICGYLDVDDPLFDPALRALPSIFVVRPMEAAAAWLESSLTYVLEATETGRDESQILTRLPALLFTEVLRLHLASAPAADHGWLAALRDPVLAPALAELHRAPDRMDRRRPGRGRERLALIARRAVPRHSGSISHPLSHRLAPAPRQGSPRHHGRRRGRGRPACRVRLRGGVQPCLQARVRLRALALAG